MAEQMNTARQTIQRNALVKAILRLSRDAAQTRSDLFDSRDTGGGPDWQRRVMKRLEEAGIISAESAGRFGAMHYIYISDQDQKKLAEDINFVTRILWPAQAVPELPEGFEDEDPEASDMVGIASQPITEQDTAFHDAPGVEPEEEDDQEDESDEEIPQSAFQEAILKLLMGISKDQREIRAEQVRMLKLFQRIAKDLGIE